MTDYLIITSSQDKASMNIRDKLLSSKSCRFKETELTWHNHSLFIFDGFVSEREKNKILQGQVYLGLTNERLIFLNDLKLDKSDINPDFLIFASRHRSKTAKPAFLTHTTGIWSGDTKFGGRSQEVSYSNALMIKAAFLSLLEQKSIRNVKGYSVDLEVSHHGPTNLEKPIIFMELGSAPEQWDDTEAGIIVADAMTETIVKYEELKENRDQKLAIGFGGTHYAPQFQKILKETNIAVSHICPKYYIQNLDKSFIEQIIQKNENKIDYFIIDWKGTNSAEKKHLIPILEEFDIPYKKSKDF
ncbi:MAG: hypothetical protein GF383_07110 [Candidatus Lokiarchaeota archaeon]|nr:hypothetical protein [Candidatus Lokiarchaeota archaeon]MBD3339930.1 hypothetical protein [Candidatus Lokiarchaeota archaeon]